MKADEGVVLTESCDVDDSDTCTCTQYDLV